jgi:hypothetical protein
VKHKKIKGGGLQINMIKRALTPRGEEQVALLAFCNIASSVPRLEWDGGTEDLLFFKCLS